MHTFQWQEIIYYENVLNFKANFRYMNANGIEKVYFYSFEPITVYMSENWNLPYDAVHTYISLHHYCLQSMNGPTRIWNFCLSIARVCHTYWATIKWSFSTCSNNSKIDIILNQRPCNFNTFLGPGFLFNHCVPDQGNIRVF